MRLVALCRVVQPELLVFEQVAVVGQKRNAVVHFQCAFSLKLEIPDGIEGVGEVARHCVQPGEPYRRGVQLTEAQADVLLRKDLRKFCDLYSQYGKDSVLLGALAYNCGPGVVNKSSILKKLRRGDRNIFKEYTAHCRYKGKFHKQLHQRRMTEFAALFIK